MATLYFKVGADWDNVVKLRNEINKLENQLKNFGQSMPEQEIRRVETRLSQATKEFDNLTKEAAIAGAGIERDFKQRIYEASQVVNDFTKKIIDQKAVVKEVEADVERLGEAYRDAVKSNRYGSNDEALGEWKAAKKVLEEEKAALFGLTQEQATARLSVKALRDEYALMKDDSEDVTQSVDDIKDAFIGISKNALGAIGIGVGVKEFVGQMVKVRSEFQAADTAIQTLLGSKEKADELMSKVREYAKISPLEFSDVTSATQMMLGFNIEAEKVPKFLAAIGDVSMGETSKFNSLTLAFSQMSAAGKLMGQDLNQMINAGFNPLQQIAETTGKSISQLKDEMSKGAITAEMVQQAFIDATSAGGKFYNMSENASKTITGQLSMMQDAIDMAFNEMGQTSEGVITKGIELATSLIQNYETIGKVLAGLIATYGTYKAALLVVSAIEAARNKTLIANITATKAYTTAQMALNAVMKANPYVLLATAIVGVGTAMWMLHDSTTAEEKAQKALNDTLENVKREQEEYNSKTQDAINIASDDTKSTTERQEALDSLISRYPSIIQKYIDEKGYLKDIIELKREIAQIDEQQKVTRLSRAADDADKYLSDLHKAKRLGNYNYARDATEWYEKLTGKSGGYDEMIAFAEKYAKDLRRTAARTSTENKNSSFSETIGKLNDENLAALLKSDEDNLKKFIGKVGYVYDKYTKDYLTKSDFEARIAKTQGIQTARTGTTHNKKYWSDKKKEAQAELDALSDIEAKGKKGQELRNKISQYEDKLKAYSSSKADIADKTRNASKKASDDLLVLQRKTQQDELALLDGQEKKMNLIEQEYKEREDAIKKHIETLAKANKATGAKDLNDNGLTTEQQAEIDKARDLSNKQRVKAQADLNREELQAMRDYLKEYGSLEQRRLAITEDYEERIRKAQTEGQRLALQKEKEKMLSSMTFENISMGIDWHSLLSGVGTLSQEMMKPMLEQLEAYTNTPEYNQADMQEREKVTELIQELRRYIGTDHGSDWMMLATATKDFSDSVARYKDAVQLEKEAMAAREKSKEEYGRGEISKEDFDKVDITARELGEKTVIAREEMQSLGKTLNDISDNVKSYVSPLTATLNKLVTWKGVDGFDAIGNNVASIDALKGALDTTLPSIGDGMAKSIGSSLSSAIGLGLSSLDSGISSILSSGMGNIVGIVAQIPQLILNLVGSVKNMIVSVLDSITELISLRWIDDLVNSILNAIGDLVNAIFDLPENLYKVLESIVVNGVGGLLNDVVGRIGNVLTLGALSSSGPADWFTNSNGKEVSEIIERLTNRNELLQTAIENLTDEIKIGKGTKSVAAATKAKQLQRETNDNYLQMAKSQAGYHGSHHSWNYYWNGFSQEQINRLSGQIGRSWNGDIWSLSPEEMKILQSNVDMWEQIGNTGKSYYGSAVQEKLQNYIDQASKLEELTNQLYESLTGITFDGMYSSFVDNLMDMKYDAKAASEDIAEYFTRAMVSNKIGEIYSDKLKSWWENFGEAMKDNDLSKEEREALQDEYMQYVNEAIKIRDDIFAATGYNTISGTSSQQGGSSRTFEGASQGQMDEANGRLTALQVYAEQELAMNGQNTEHISLINTNLETLIAFNGGIRDISADIQDIIAQSYLELVGIRENTEAIVKPIKNMSDKIDKWDNKIMKI